MVTYRDKEQPPEKETSYTYFTYRVLSRTFLFFNFPFSFSLIWDKNLRSKNVDQSQNHCGYVADEPWVHGGKFAILSLFNRYYFGRCSSELAELVPLPYFCGRYTLSR